MTTPRIVLLHWGTRGAGPQMQAGLAAQMSGDGDAYVSVSYDRASESSGALTALHVPQLVVGDDRQLTKARYVRRLLAQPVDAVRLARFCRAERIDTIVEVMDHPLQIMPKLVSRVLGTRVLGSVHDARRHKGEESRILDLLTRMSFRGMDGVLTFSHSVAGELRGVLKSRRIRIFPTILPALGELRSSHRDAPSGRAIVGFFGRVERYKGVGRLIRAVAVLQERGVDVVAHVVGRGDLDPDDLRTLEETHGSVDARWVDEADIQGIIESFDLLALPYDEASQSGVVGFALNSGVPVVATPAPGLVEQVSDSGGGVIASDFSDEAFADSIAHLLSAPELYEQHSRAGMTAAQSTFSWRRCADDIIAAVAALQRPDQPR